MKRPLRQQKLIATLLAACLLTAGVYGLVHVMRLEREPLLDRVTSKGTLVVATRRSPATYFQGANGPDGFELALTQAFAAHLGVDVEYVFPDTLGELFDATLRGTVDLAAAALTVTPERQRTLAFSIPYAFVTEQLVYRRGSRRPASLTEVAAGDLHVIAGSSHEETLEQLRGAAHPELSWRSHAQGGTERLLRLVDQGRIRLTVADSTEAALSRRVYRHAVTAFDLGDPQPVAWAFRRSTDDSLRAAADRFISQAQQDGTLQVLRARYFGHSGRLNFVESRAFWRNVRDRLPALRQYFEEAAQNTDLDWRLLAAIGYQESHWRADAVSPTGVRGVMMLTRATAGQVGVEDRRDPRQSILGGARYLRTVEKRLPARIQGPNRLWLTLAAYNVGFGHLEDARILTQRDGADPDLWLEVKQRLPLLRKKRYYKTVRYGFARGDEAVNYVDNIRNYYDMLVWYTTTRDRATVERLLAAEATD